MMKSMLKAMLLCTAITFSTTATAQYYTEIRKQGDTIFFERKLKDGYILRWTRYTFVDKDGVSHRVYLDNGKPVYSQNRRIRKLPKEVREIILSAIRKEERQRISR